MKDFLLGGLRQLRKLRLMILVLIHMILVVQMVLFVDFTAIDALAAHSVSTISTTSAASTALVKSAASTAPSSPITVTTLVESKAFASSTTSFADSSIVDCIASVGEENSFGYGIRVGVIDSGVNKINDNVIEGYNYLENNTDTTDNKGHGTTIASIIAEIAPNAKIIPLKCTEKNQITDNSAIITAIYKAVDDFKCDVINISIGMPDTQELKAAIDYAAKKGVIIVSAVGNDGELSYKRSKVYYPAGYENVVGVGSIDENNIVSSFSQRNKSVFVVTSSKEQGTSFAAAKISGAAVIAKSFDRSMSVWSFMQYLKDASSDLGDEGYDTSYGNGVLDFELLVKNLKAENPVYITYLDGEKFMLFNSKEEVVSGILVFIDDNDAIGRGSDLFGMKIEILPQEEKEFNLDNHDTCFFWLKNKHYIIWIKRG